MTEESKELTQMLLTTMVTNENMKWSFLSGGRVGGSPRVGGDLEPYGLVDAFTLLVLAWMTILLFFVYWRSRRKQTTKRVKVTFLEQVRQHHQQEYYHEEEEAESISDHDEDHSEEEEEAILSPPSVIKSMTKAMVEELPEIVEEDADLHDMMSPSKRCSLRLALKKHRSLGSGWEDSGERYSLRVASHHH